MSTPSSAAARTALRAGIPAAFIAWTKPKLTGRDCRVNGDEPAVKRDRDTVELGTMWKSGKVKFGNLYIPKFPNFQISKF
jgi:hypothetical protein